MVIPTFTKFLALYPDKLYLPCVEYRLAFEPLTMLSTCFKRYILVLRDKNVAFTLYTGECWAQSGRVYRKPDRLAFVHQMDSFNMPVLVC